MYVVLEMNRVCFQLFLFCFGQLFLVIPSGISVMHYDSADFYFSMLRFSLCLDRNRRSKYSLYLVF